VNGDGVLAHALAPVEAPSDASLMSTMMGRLGALEKQLQLAQKEIASKVSKCSCLAAHVL
jgi:hypothetical protein